MIRVSKLLIAFGALSLILASAVPSDAQCAKIKDGTITAKDGVTVLTTGFDQWGYNYQAHMFNGLYENYTRPFPPVTESSVNLIMKWSDEWIANVDCDGDGKLDRGLDVKAGTGPTGISRGWLTNHMEGDCTNAAGELEHFTYFTKIVWVGPATDPDPWADKRIWGEYAIIEEVSNNAPPNGDPGTCGGTNGGDRTKLVNPAGLGFYTK